MNSKIFINIGFSKEEAIKLNKKIDQLAKDLTYFKKNISANDLKNLVIYPPAKRGPDLMGIGYSSVMVKKNCPYFYRIFPFRFIPERIKARAIFKLIEQFKD